MRQAIDKALLFIIGGVNKAVFSATRGSVVLYRFGRLGVLLTVTGPAKPIGETMLVGYLPHGDDYIVLATEAESRLPAALRTATAATIERADQQIPVDITLLTDDTERAALLKHASIHERNEITRHREAPIARLTPRYKPATDGSVASPQLL